MRTGKVLHLTAAVLLGCVIGDWLRIEYFGLPSHLSGSISGVVSMMTMFLVFRESR